MIRSAHFYGAPSRKILFLGGVMTKIVGVAREILFLRGKWQTMCGVAQSLCETQKRNFVGECQKVGGNTNISGKYKNIGEIQKYRGSLDLVFFIRRRADILV